MKIIEDTFKLILKFHRQLTSGGWHAGADGTHTHRNLAQLKHTYKAFHGHSTFLFKGLGRYLLLIKYFEIKYRFYR